MSRRQGARGASVGRVDGENANRITAPRIRGVGLVAASRAGDCRYRFDGLNLYGAPLPFGGRRGLRPRPAIRPLRAFPWRAEEPGPAFRMEAQRPEADGPPGRSHGSSLLRSRSHRTLVCILVPGAAVRASSPHASAGGGDELIWAPAVRGEGPRGSRTAKG